MCRITTNDHAVNPDSIENDAMNDATRDSDDQYKPHETIGDAMSLPKPLGCTRIYVQNPNGISVELGGTLPLTLEHIANAEADICVFPEINLDTTKTAVKNKIHEGCRRQFGIGKYKTTILAGGWSSNHRWLDIASADLVRSGPFA